MPTRASSHLTIETPVDLPGSDVPSPASAETGSAHASAASTKSVLDIVVPPELRGTARCQPDHSNTRLEFRRLFLAGRLAEARRVAEEELSRPECAERAAWVNNLANVAREQGNLREAFSLYLSGAHLLSETRDAETIAKFYNSFGMTSQELGRLHGVREYFDRALFCYQQAAHYYARAGLPLKVAYAENNTGWLYATSSAYPERAHAHIDKAQLLFNDGGEMARVASCEDTRALALEKQGDYVSGFESSARAVAALARFGEAERASFERARATLLRLLGKLGETR